MVRAILAGTKTQTRRVIKPQPKPHTYDCVNLKEAYPNKPWCWLADWLKPDGSVMSYDEWREPHGGWPDRSKQFACPYGVPGDRLWVREDVITHSSIPQVVGYVADGCQATERWEKRRNSIRMPRWASRITLEITEVRVQRLQNISDEDAQAEGGWGGGCFHRSFAGLWDSINAKRGFGWDVNPWVWVVGFKRVGM
jgi:hypothetical protein